jgi:23S rRNA (cytidine1920-2'-O)/16S rRNA (cytidine1409-2'-O)-methyltransferase
VNPAAARTVFMKSKTTRVERASGSSQKNAKPGKARLDVLLAQRGLAPSRERAQALLLAGQVRVNGMRMEKPGSQVPADARIEVIGEELRYASRGGLKLEGAIQDFALAPQGKVCLDIGSSTGGFTDCLLQHGARKVYCVDVTTSQLDWKLRRDPRVVLVQCNARYLRPEDIGEGVEFTTLDLSFISVTKVLPAVVPIAAPAAEFLILVKPQFELEKREVGKGGIVRDRMLHEKAVERVVRASNESGLIVESVRPSHPPGAEGNQEFFLHARRGG